MDEIWKKSYIYPSQYEVSNFGRVRNVATKQILKPQIDAKGYERVRLSYHNKRASAKVHRLVAVAFISNPDQKPQVNHIDGNKKNNAVDNLEWSTNSENQIHAFKYGLNYVTGRAGRKRIPVIQKSKDGSVICRFSSIGDASRETGIQRHNIEKVVHGSRHTAGGFIWESEVMPYDEAAYH